MRVAYYSPLPPSRSGIADYSALLLPALRERMDVVVARPGRFRRAPKADVHLYHVGNDPVEHGWIVEALARGLDGRVQFAGRVDDESLADLYARCLAVYYAPVDEDFGMVPYEAFLSGKPVVTTTDAGGPLEIVQDRETGVVVAPDAAEIARACAYLGAHAGEAEAWGRAGRGIAERVTWDACVDALLS